MSVSRDAYVSFRGSRRRDFGEVADPEPVILVDLESDDVELLRSLPPSLLGQHDGTLLLRLADPTQGDESTLDRLKNLLERWPQRLRVALLCHPIGQPARIEVLTGQALDSDQQGAILRRARAVELEALLEFGQAIWRPAGYHYRLITGEHAAAYIKLGDAIRGPRDAVVLAAWLHHRVRSGVGLVLDTGTLTPVAQALELAAIGAGVRLGPVVTLDNYPRTSVDIDYVLDRASGDVGRIIIALSISSSGSLLERVLGALDRKGASLVEAAVEVLVAKGPLPDRGDQVVAWTPLPGQPPLVPRGSRDRVGCKLCRQPGKAYVVPINPFTFDALLPTQLRPVVPDIQDPAENRGLWEAAEQTGALSVERAAHTALRRYRSDKVPMGIVLQAERLVPSPTFQTALAGKIRQCLETEEMPGDSDLVLVPAHEHDYESFAELWEGLRPLIAPSVELPEPYPIDGEFSEALIERVRAASRILVFALGTVSGASIQRALVGVQHARTNDPPGQTFELHAFVVHARPATAREWESIRNSYGRRGHRPQLRYGWKSILPDRSPLREEGALLRRLDPETFDADTQAFLSRRLELCRGSYEGGGATVLWGATPDTHLTPNAIYGDRLGGVSTYVAVGSAMAAAIFAPGASIPELRVFEIPAIARSYYDPLILGSILRWMRPHEAFWGWTATEASTTALHIVDRADIDDRHILVPEMLLAAAQGKLTLEAAKVVVGVARQLLETAPTYVRAALDLGLTLVGDLGDLLPTEGVYDLGGEETD